MNTHPKTPEFFPLENNAETPLHSPNNHQDHEESLKDWQTDIFGNLSDDEWQDAFGDGIIFY